jgi:hypothetical protein
MVVVNMVVDALSVVDAFVSKKYQRRHHALNATTDQSG